MTYKESIEFLFSRLPVYQRIGKAAYKENLDNTIAFDNYFGHPHLKYKTVHIGGTNGKGSVSHMLASILQEAGYRTGLYTSPHLKDFRERIRINGTMIPEEAVTGFIEEHHKKIGRIMPSFFELTVVMAFDFFRRAGVDIAVIEVGLGGRLDSTNIITPVLSAITNIGHDHMDLLGDTIEKIAIEKAGIIKEHIPVVIGETQAELKDIFLTVAAEKHSGISFADFNSHCSFDNMEISGEMRPFTIIDHVNNKRISGLSPLYGDYQEKNLVTLYEIFSGLRKNLNLSEVNFLDGIRNVIKNTGLKGRFQILGRKPMTICDTGHNPEGIEQVIMQITNIKSRTLHIILGFVNDKDLSVILPLFPRNAVYYFTKAGIARALDEKILLKQAAQLGLRGNDYKSVSEAYAAAKREAAEPDLIFIGGSTFIVAEVI